MFLNLIIFAGVLVLFALVCKRNLKNRTEELKNNLYNFNENILSYFNSMSNEAQKNFFHKADDKVIENLKRVLENRYLYGNNAWSIQQQIFEQQILFTELNKSHKKYSVENVIRD